MSTERPLILQERLLPPSSEWRPDTRFWSVVRVATGAGYCFADHATWELKLGDVVVLGPRAEAACRASQLAQLKLEYFTVELQLLPGLIAVTEWHQLEKASARQAQRVFHHAAASVLAQKFARLAALAQREGLPVRLAFLQLWASCLTSLFPVAGAAVPGSRKFHVRFHQFFSQLSEQDLGARSLAELAGELNCSERHLSRLFRAEFGLSLRACQNEVRLQRACRLLADPQAKVSRVARECGYRQLSLFNRMFKRRFGVTPGQWRLHLSLASPAAAGGWLPPHPFPPTQ